MRTVHVHSSAPTPSTVQVPGTAPVQTIVQRVNAAYAQGITAQPATVQLFINGKAVADLHTTQVPAATDQVTAVVRAQGQRAVSVKSSRICLLPLSTVINKDLHDPVTALTEVFDNSIEAAATRLTATVAPGADGTAAELRYSDNGAGMDEETAMLHLKLNMTTRKLQDHFASREYNMPLPMAAYFSNKRGGDGRGATAPLYFGSQLEVITKAASSLETVKITADQQRWMDADQPNNMNNTYEAEMEAYIDCEPDGRTSFTDITVSSLYPALAAKLGDMTEQLKLAQKLHDVYNFDICGIPPKLWDTISPALRPASAARPTGGLTISLFKLELSQDQGLPTNMPPPRVRTLLERYLQLSQDFGEADGQPKLMPLWLPIRVVEPGMAVEQELSLADVKKDRPLDYGPVGQLSGVHRDFMLLVLPYTFQKGQRTKPELRNNAGTEDVLFPFWRGRMVARDCSPHLPRIFAAAQSSRVLQGTAQKLTGSRVCCFLFCSPEVHMGPHTASIDDAAFEAVIHRLGDPTDTCGDLFVWDATTGMWCGSHNAGDVLAQHVKTHWVPLEPEGELQGDKLLDGRLVFRTLQLPNGRKVHENNLVRVLTQQDMLDAAQEDSSGDPAAAAAAAGPSRDPRRSGRTQARSRGSSSSRQEWPTSFGIVQHFWRKEDPVGGSQIMAKVAEWAPARVLDGLQAAAGAGGGAVQWAPAVSDIPAAGIDWVSPERTAKLQASWEKQAPARLSWFKPALRGARDKGTAVSDVNQLPDVPSDTRLTAQQVPRSLTVCFVDSEGNPTTFHTVRPKVPCWFKSQQDNADVNVDWQLLVEDELLGDTEVAHVKYRNVSGGAISAKYDDVNLKATLSGWHDVGFVEQPGKYLLQVIDDRALVLDVSWDRASLPSRTAVPPVRLTEQLPVLEVRVKDSDGKAATFPFSSEEINAALVVGIEAINTTAANPTIQHTHGQVELSADRKLLTLTDWRLAPQKLPQPNTPGTHLEARVSLQLALPNGLDGALVGPADTLPHLFVLSGKPSKLGLSGPSARDHMCPKDRPAPIAVTGGPLLEDISVYIQDAWSNNADLEASQAFCARIMFDPAAAAEATQGAVGAASGSSSRRKQGQAAPPQGYPLRVEGNRVFLEGLRWCAPPGAGPVGMTLEVFEGKTLPTAASAKPIAKHTAWYNMQEILAILQHDSLSEFHQAQSSMHKERWEGWQGRKPFRWSRQTEPVPFVLSSLNLPPNMTGSSRLLPQPGSGAGRTVRDELANRFVEGFQPTLDVVQGGLVQAYLTPSGANIFRVKAGEQLLGGKVPARLGPEWNRLVSTSEVYEAAFVLPPTLQQLAGLGLECYSKAGQLNQFFQGQAKLCLLEADGTYTCLEQQATQQLAIVHGQAELPPITIQPDWFTSNNKGIATIAVVSRPQAEAAAGSSSAQPWQRPPQQELGRLYLRLAPAAERLLVMPAGKLFEGAVLSIDSAPSSKRGAGRGQVTLQQWRFTLAGDKSGRVSQQYLDPRDAQIAEPLQLKLGQLTTLHLIATDWLGMPAALSKAQQRRLGSSVSSQGNDLVRLLSEDGTAYGVQVQEWNWARPHATTTAPAAPISSTHLGGPFVNSFTFKVTSGSGRATLRIQHTDSLNRPSPLDIPVLVLSGPVAVDGLTPQSATVQPPAAVAQRAPSTAAAVQQYPCRFEGLVDMRFWTPLVKSEPEAQQARKRKAAPDSVVDLTTDSDGDDTAAMIVDQGQQAQQQPLSPMQQWLNSLNRANTARLFSLEGSPRLVEGSTVKLPVQLLDSSLQVAATEQGNLELYRLQNWPAIQQQQQQVVPVWKRVGSAAAVKDGKADVSIQLGTGDEWVGEQRFLLVPVPPAGVQYSTAFAAVLPALMRVIVVPGPFPKALEQAKGLFGASPAAATGSSLCPIAGAWRALFGPVPEEQMLQQLPSVFPADAGGGDHSPAQLAARFVQLLRPLGSTGAPAQLPDLSLTVRGRDGAYPAASSLRHVQFDLQRWQAPAEPAAGAGTVGSWECARAPAAAGSNRPLAVNAREMQSQQQQQQQQRMPGFDVPPECSQLPHVAGLYRLVAKYKDARVGADLQLVLGPYLLLPGPPQQAAVLEQAAAGQPVQVVAENDLGSTHTLQQTVQLKDAWGNDWTPAAAAAAAAAAQHDPADAAGSPQPGPIPAAKTPQRPSKRQKTAAAAERQARPGSPTGTAAGGGGAEHGQDWQLHLWLQQPATSPLSPAAAAAGGSSSSGGTYVRSLPFDEFGCCVVPSEALNQWGINSVGQWHLWGQAAQGSADGGGSRSSSISRPDFAAAAAAGAEGERGSSGDRCVCA